MHRRQISLRTLMVVTALLPPLAGVAVGAFGEIAALMFWGYILVIAWSVVSFLVCAALVFLPLMALVALVEWALGLHGRRGRAHLRSRPVEAGSG